MTEEQVEMKLINKQNACKHEIVDENNFCIFCGKKISVKTIAKKYQ